MSEFYVVRTLYTNKWRSSLISLSLRSLALRCCSACTRSLLNRMIGSHVDSRNILEPLMAENMLKVSLGSGFL